jgi:hypothetical protein
MPSVIQRSFAGGEISPQLNGRADQAKYATGLKTCRNAVVQKHGSVVNRAGFEYIATVKDSTKAVSLMPFVFNDDETYLIEVGDGYLRFYQDGEQLAVSSVVAWSNATAYVAGDIASLAGVNYYCILAHTNHTPANATYWYPLTGSIFEVPTPYAEADLFDLQYVQSADVVTIVHPNYAPRELARTGQTAWTLSEIAFTPTIDAPTGVGGTGSGGAISLRYSVTAIQNDTGSESYATGAGTVHIGTITNISQATLAEVFCSGAHGMGDGDEVEITGVVGMTEVNSRRFIIDIVSPTKFRLRGTDSTSYAAYVSGGTATSTTAGDRLRRPDGR